MRGSKSSGHAQRFSPVFWVIASFSVPAAFVSYLEAFLPFACMADEVIPGVALRSAGVAIAEAVGNQCTGVDV